MTDVEQQANVSLSPPGTPLDPVSAAALICFGSGGDVPSRTLDIATLQALGGVLAGRRFVKLVYDSETDSTHFINNAGYAFHADYIAENVLGMKREELERTIDAFNKSVYMSEQRRFYVGILSVVGEGKLALETVEVDTMDLPMVQRFYAVVRRHVDAGLQLLFKPANHGQEAMMAQVDAQVLPRIFESELYASSTFLPLNYGTTVGRIRLFHSREEYDAARSGIRSTDIIVMARVPDDIPRVAGVINGAYTTPLSHTNVLASGWHIPNAIQLGIIERIENDNLDDQWVEFSVRADATEVRLERVLNPPTLAPQSAPKPMVQVDAPETGRTPIKSLSRLRMADNYRFGTKAANLGEVHHLLNSGSARLLGYYCVPRPPREDLLPYLRDFLRTNPGDDVQHAALHFLRQFIRVPRGIAIPFAFQQAFCESSPRIQQQIGKLKMALKLDAPAELTNELATKLQAMIRETRMPESVRDYIDAQIVQHLPGSKSFIIRSSSNAEDIVNFSAAGLYESVAHVRTDRKIFEGIKEVWASLISPRGIRLRHDAQISLDDSYMAVIVQEEVESSFGGVMVTTNPTQPDDFRNVFINASVHSVQSVVDGTELPYQLLYNTVEGGGRTLSTGTVTGDLSQGQKRLLQRLAFAGRLLQSHFSTDYSFASPLDIEWLAGPGDEYVNILQVRPYAG